MGGGPGGPARAGRRPHRLGQDPRGVPVGARPAGRRSRRPTTRSTAAGSSTSRRSRRWRSTCSATCARRWPASGRPRSGSGSPVPDVTVGMRTGDTPADERRLFARTPPDVLVTTPESLFLLLTSAARESLRGVRTVILDEVHAVAGTKRGAHLALSLERLDALLDADDPRQRIGLSATVRPLDEVATFLAGARPVEVVQPPHAEDGRGVRRGAGARPRRAGRAAGAGLVGRGGDRLGGGHGAAAVDLARRGAAAAGAGPAAPLDDRVRQLAAAGRAAHGAAQRARGRGGRGGGRAGPRRATAERASSFPAEAIGQSGIGGGAPPVVAKAHHGSMSREQRTLVEEELKGGLLPCVVATSSLELGIDMGAVDLVVQVEAPPSVASGLQRVGRAGPPGRARCHRAWSSRSTAATSSSCAVVAERMTAGAIESLRYPRNPLDVLAQHVVAMVALEPWTVGDLAARGAPGGAVRRAARLRAARRAGHAGRALPVRGVRRAAGADHLGPGHRRAARAARVRSGWPSPPAARSPTAGCSPS